MFTLEAVKQSTVENWLECFHWFAVLVLLFTYPLSWFRNKGSANIDFINQLNKILWKNLWNHKLLSDLGTTWEFFRQFPAIFYQLTHWLWTYETGHSSICMCTCVWLCCQLSGVILMLCAAGDHEQMNNLVSELIKQFANSTRWSHRQL